MATSLSIVTLGLLGSGEIQYQILAAVEEIDITPTDSVEINIDNDSMVEVSVDTTGIVEIDIENESIDIDSNRVSTEVDVSDC